ncbi:MAG: glycosyltransferase family A protein [Caulobacteraceae bacterium]
MTATPAVSVITPTRNRAKLLRETLASVAAQTFADWEHVVVDDGSDDETPAIMAERTATDPRVSYVIRQSPTAGANVCRNIGAALAKAPLLVFVDDDDLLAPECLGSRVEVMRRNADVDFAVFHAEIFERAPGDLGRAYQNLDPADDLLRFLALDCPWQTSGPVWRRAYLADLGGFDEELQSMQDLELHVRALCRRPNYLVVPTTDHYIRAQLDDARTSTRHFNDADMIRRSEAVPGKLQAHVERAGLLTWSRRRALLGLEFGAAERWVRTGRLGEGLRSWREACRRSRAPRAIAAGGALMLRLIRLHAAEAGWASRVLNKWKGWVRFRQEPTLTP